MSRELLLFRDPYRVIGFQILEQLALNKMPTITTWPLAIYGYALEFDNPMALEYLHKLKCPMTAESFAHIALTGSIKNAEILRSLNCPVDHRAVANAIRTNNTAMLLWLHHNIDHCHFNVESSIIAAESGTIHTLKWLYKNGHLNLPPKVFNRTIRRGNLAIIDWFINKDCSFDESSFSLAIRLQKHHLIEIFKEKNCPFDKKVFTAAVKAANIELMQWLYAHGCPSNPNVFYAALSTNDINVINWFKGQVVLTPIMFEYVLARSNRSGPSCIKILNWLSDNNCPISKNLGKYASKCTTRAVQIWLHYNGFPNENLLRECASSIKIEHDTFKLWREKFNKI